MKVLKYFWLVSEAVVQRFSVEKVFLEISQNSQENTCARVSFLTKLQVAAPVIFIFYFAPAKVLNTLIISYC